MYNFMIMPGCMENACNKCMYVYLFNINWMTNNGLLNDELLVSIDSLNI